LSRGNAAPQVLLHTSEGPSTIDAPIPREGGLIGPSKFGTPFRSRTFSQSREKRCRCQTSPTSLTKSMDVLSPASSGLSSQDESRYSALACSKQSRTQLTSHLSTSLVKLWLDSSVAN